jgi:hypothetical protein
MEKSFQENDISPMVARINYLFNYTAAQMQCFKEEWKLMYQDWYWENVPAE